VLFDSLLTEWEKTARQLCCRRFDAAWGAWKGGKEKGREANFAASILERPEKIRSEID
jgi:hypothetical protein